MKTKTTKTSYLSAWNQMMKPEMFRKIFDDINFTGWEITGIESISVYSRKEAGCMVNISCGDQIEKVYVSFLIGAPHWSHFMDLVYGHGRTADIQIIACSKDFVESKNDESHGNIHGISQLAEYYNERGCKIFVLQMKKLEQMLKGTTDSFEVKIFQGLTEEPKVPSDGYAEIPTLRQLQESEFWLDFYWPVWSMELYAVYDNLRDCNPSQCLSNNCTQEIQWTDNGLTVNIAGPAGNDFLKLTWNQGRSMIMNELPECRIYLEGDEDNIAGIDIHLLDLPMTELLSLSSAEKRNYADFLYGMERKIEDIMMDFESEYEQCISKVKK